MSIYKDLSNLNDIKTVKGIRFCILSPDEIKRMSVAEIFKTDTYLGLEPVVNGLFDPRMGVIDYNRVCQTCEHKNTFCPGHFGHINLAKPVFYVQFFDIVKKILKCVCFRCSKLLIDQNNDKIQGILKKKITRQKKWELIYKQCSKIKRCGSDCEGGCGAKQPDKITKEPIIKIVMEWKEEEKTVAMSAEDVLRILKRISDSDSELMGFSKTFNRPDWMICTVMPVPPPSVRPSVRTDTGQRSEDDLTHKLCDIVKSNNALKSKIEKGASKEQVDIATQVLQYHVATFIDNKIPGINPAQQRTGRLLKSLTERLKSKDGRIRGNLMGKRVDFSARSVITPDANISIDELGVPLKIAMNLTFPEIVNKYNKERLKKYVVNGPTKYPGAKFIRKGEWTKSLKNMPDRENIVLEDGDVVDRHIIDGDPVLFNRQPSLHKYSMMCHKVKVMPFNTFRLNVSVCPCYNSDFDGDEMNMHVAQSVTTATELMELASVSSQIISARECKPIISIVQDVALGVFRITKSNVKLSDKQFYNLLASNAKFAGHIPAAMDGKKWTGKQIMSTIIPKNINISCANKSYEGKDDKENYVVIENGILKQGVLDKLVYQNRTRGLVHSIYNECGQEDTRLFFDNTQKIICDWLVQSGFSVGISDLIINDDGMQMKNMIKDMKVKVYDIIRDMHKGTFENKSINNNDTFFEEEVNKILNQTISQVGKIALSKLNDIENRMINMVKSGSKGSIINVSQMIACLGQQNVDGKRIPYGFDDRTLPHYTKYDDGPESRGFVENSFISGLSPQEFFFHSMGGREGLIDTAVKSVAWETPIFINYLGEVKRVRIGEWIDAYIESKEEDVKHYPEQARMEYLKISDYDDPVYILSVDSYGDVEWRPLTAVTRHDPGVELFKVFTRSGREVIVTEADSLLVYNTFLSNELVEASVHDVEIGSLLPITEKFNDEFSNSTDVISFLSDKIEKDGYFVGNMLNIKCTSEQERDDLVLKCASQGIFVEINEQSVKIHGRWLEILATITNRVIPHHVNLKDKYDSFGGVVLDPIVRIEKVSVEDHPKMYDVTVPGTLNFALANGLNVRDTSETGYIQRKLVKAMEDCKINYDYTVRNASGAIIQLLYGEDGMDAAKIESQPIIYIEDDYQAMMKNYLITSEKDVEPFTQEKARYVMDPKEVARYKAHFDQIIADKEFMIQEIFNSKKDSSIMYPISFLRLINNAKALNKQTCFQTDLKPSYVLDTIEQLCDDLYITKKNKGNKFLQILIRCYLSPKKVICGYNLSKVLFDDIVKTVRYRFYDSIAHPSEMVGIIAAQSIGEPLSQMTLNTFHLSGVSSASKAVRGVPRIKELLSVTKNIKSPSLTIYIDEESRVDKKKATYVLNSIETTRISEIVMSSKIYYDPFDEKSNIDEDMEIVNSYKDFEELSSDSDTYPWLLRLEFDREKMHGYDIKMIDVYRALTDFYDNKLQVLFSDDNASKLIFRIKLYNDGDAKNDVITDIKAIEANIMENVIIKGVKRINKVSMQKTEYLKYIPEKMDFEKYSEWILESNGSNLLDILCQPHVDQTRTHSNNINEIYEIFGIEAARQALYNELSDVIKDSDLYVNYRHISLLVDIMTTKGYLLSIDRHGINRVDIGPLAKSSFEETTDMIIKAGIFSEIDKINGVSANIMLGQIPPCGTGDTTVIIDEKILDGGVKVTKTNDDIEDDIEENFCEDILNFDYSLPLKSEVIQKKVFEIKFPTI
jgi:DNA-directed RNA polymerase beta' subunit